MSVPASTPFQVYDTTLRDGAQQEGMNLSVADKLAIAPLLDELGVGFIEGGWPGAVPKDTEFFKRAAKELDFRNAELAAFGSTRKAGTRAVDDPQVRALVDSEAPVVALVAKHDLRHAERALRTTGDENIAMIADTVAFLVREGRRVVVDAEHFFDGYRFDPAYSRAAVLAGFEAGAEVVALCDTNGGMVPTWVAEIVHEIRGRRRARTPSSACTRTTTPAARSPTRSPRSRPGARTSRAPSTGTASAPATPTCCPSSPTCSSSTGCRCSRSPDGLPGGLRELTRIAHAISEITNISPFARSPYVGASAFAHKAGLHASAIKVDPDLYQHIDPAAVGNDMRMLISDMAGRASIELKGRELGFDLAGRPSCSAGSRTASRTPRPTGTPTRRPTRRSSCCCSRRSTGSARSTSGSSRGGPSSSAAAARGTPATAEATVKLHAGGERDRQHGRGQRAGQRARPRAAPGAASRSTRSSRRSSSSTSRCASSTRCTAPTRSRAC